MDSKNNSYKYSKIQNCKQELERVKTEWRGKLEKLQVSTPIESINILLNGWVVYQTITSRLIAKTGYYQSGGAFGFRDQLQDTIGLKYIDSQYLKNQIIKHSKHQFEEGDVEHWWHEETGRGIRTREGEKTGTIYEHCIKAIEKSLVFGENGLPKIGSGDWNDGMNKVGNKGKGESIWLGFFLYSILNKFIPIIQKRGDTEYVEKYEKIKQNLKKALNTNGWDGRWYKRAYTDDGKILGSMENEECRIDSIAQSWATISDAGDNDKKHIS